ncbi:MAG: hypothetical protein JO235_24165 [Chroococcidiopsidaceae cyanobacterium CP_BM_RX_35]|nr:hypothetical protein [Chroococcidiopsidaceae cyanobacterium CP_BM_RX_35]
MLVKTKTVKGNKYFYLVESRRVKGKAHPIHKAIAYLGNQERAIPALQASNYPDKDRLLAQVLEAAPGTGKNQGKRGRPRKPASGAITPSKAD